MKVLVTSCTNNSALVAMRALSREGFDVIGADERGLPFGLHSRYSSPYERLLPPDHREFVACLRGVLEKHRPEIFLPFGTTIEVCKAKSELTGLTKVLLPEPDSFSAVNDKRLVVEQCARFGIATPPLLDREFATRALERGDIAGVVVKPRCNLGGGEGVSMVSDVAELDRAIAASELHGEVLLSEYIPGPDASNIAVQVLFDRDSRLIGQFVLRKTRLQPARIGVAAAAVSVHRPDLVSRIVPVFQQLGWRGPADVEFKIDSRTGKAWLIEINARFSGAVAFAFYCGVNLPVLASRAAAGESLPVASTSDYVEGVHYWNPILYTRAVIAAARTRATREGLFQKMRDELRGPRVGSPYQFSDPAPLVGKTLLQLQEKLRPNRPEPRTS